MMKKIRLITLNVCRFKDMNGRCNFDRVANDLKLMKANLICLNEVDLKEKPQLLNNLAKELNMNVKFFGHVKGYYGNAILTSFEKIQQKNVHLRGGSKIKIPVRQHNNHNNQKEFSIHRIARGMLVLDLVLNNNKTVKLACLHLDHISMTERCEQLNHCIEELITNQKNSDIILAGDFNALTRSDYHNDHWNKLVDRAEKNNWNHPEYGEDLKILKKVGFEDCFHIQPLTPIHMNQKLTAPSDAPLYRIDYCFLRHHPEKRNFFQVEKAFVASHINHSDHLPLVVDFSYSDMSSKI